MRSGPTFRLNSGIQPLFGLLFIFLLPREKFQPLTPVPLWLLLNIEIVLLECLEKTFPLFQGLSWLQCGAAPLQDIFERRLGKMLSVSSSQGKYKLAGIPVSRHLSLWSGTRQRQISLWELGRRRWFHFEAVLGTVSPEVSYMCLTM